MQNYICIKKLFYKNKNSKFMQIIKWIIIVILLIIGVFGIRSYVRSQEKKEIEKYETTLAEVKNNFKKSLENSPKSSYELAVLGKKLLETNQTEWAVIVLEVASAKDPKYRDAALFAGYAYLRQAQEIQNSITKNNNIENYYKYYKKSIEYLNKAADIDPIYPDTFRLLTIAYQNIGDMENMQTAYQKYQDFK